MQNVPHVTVTVPVKYHVFGRYSAESNAYVDLETIQEISTGRRSNVTPPEGKETIKVQPGKLVAKVPVDVISQYIIEEGGAE